MATLPLYLVAPTALAVLAALLFLVVRAVGEGREVSFWPPRIGPRPSGSPVILKPEAERPGLLASDTEVKPALSEQVAAGASSSLPSFSSPSTVIGLLNVTSGSSHGVHYALTTDHRSLIIGRAVDCDIHFNSLWFSNRHFGIKIAPNDADGGLRDYIVVIIDMRSSEGTRVNGRLIDRATLNDEDIIQVGEVSIRFHRIYKAEPPR